MIFIRNSEQAIQAKHDPFKWSRVLEPREERDPDPAGPTSLDDAQTRPVTATLRAPVVHVEECVRLPGGTGAIEPSEPSTSALEPLDSTMIAPSVSLKTNKRSRSESQERADQGADQVPPVSTTSSNGWKELLSSRADLQGYCASRGHSLTWETLGRKRQNGQDMWTERMTIAGKYQALGQSSARKRAQAAAAEAMIRSGVLEDFADYR